MWITMITVMSSHRCTAKNTGTTEQWMQKNSPTDRKKNEPASQLVDWSVRQPDKHLVRLSVNQPVSQARKPDTDWKTQNRQVKLERVSKAGSNFEMPKEATLCHITLKLSVCVLCVPTLYECVLYCGVVYAAMSAAVPDLFGQIGWLSPLIFSN